MLESQKSVLRGVALGLLGFLIGVLSVSAYSGTAGWKIALKNLLSSATGVKANSQLAYGSCQPDQKSQDEQIFFISCGGIY